MPKWEKAPSRAWKDTWEWLLNTKAGWIAAILCGGVMSGIFVGNDFWWRVLAGFTGALIAIVLIVGLTYFVHFWITLSRQRNEARSKCDEFQTKFHESEQKIKELQLKVADAWLIEIANKDKEEINFLLFIQSIDWIWSLGGDNPTIQFTFNVINASCFNLRIKGIQGDMVIADARYREINTAMPSPCFLNHGESGRPIIIQSGLTVPTVQRLVDAQKNQTKINFSLGLLHFQIEAILPNRNPISLKDWYINIRTVRDNGESSDGVDVVPGTPKTKL